MIVFLIILIVLIAAVLFLGGEGDSYGKGSITGAQEEKFGTSDRYYFL